MPKNPTSQESEVGNGWVAIYKQTLSKSAPSIRQLTDCVEWEFLWVRHWGYCKKSFCTIKNFWVNGWFSRIGFLNCQIQFPKYFLFKESLAWFIRSDKSKSPALRSVQNHESDSYIKYLCLLSFNASDEEQIASDNEETLHNISNRFQDRSLRFIWVCKLRFR